MTRLRAGRRKRYRAKRKTFTGAAGGRQMTDIFGYAFAGCCLSCLPLTSIETKALDVTVSSTKYPRRHFSLSHPFLTNPFLTHPHKHIALGGGRAYQL